MDKTTFYWTAILSFVILVIYFARCLRNGVKLDVAALINLIVRSGGVVVGAFLTMSTFFEDLRARLVNIDLYIFIAGIAMIAVSAQGIIRLIVEGTSKSN